MGGKEADLCGSGSAGRLKLLQCKNVITCSQDSKISIQRRPRWSEYKGKSGPSSITHPTIPSTKQQPTNYRFDQNARPLQYCRPRSGRHQRYPGRKKAVFSTVAWTQSSIWRTQIAERANFCRPIHAPSAVDGDDAVGCEYEARGRKALSTLRGPAQPVRLER